MISNTFVVMALLGHVEASSTADESYTNSLADCLTFAAKFDNTCSDQTTQTAYASLATASMTCV